MGLFGGDFLCYQAYGTRDSDSDSDRTDDDFIYSYLTNLFPITNVPHTRRDS